MATPPAPAVSVSITVSFFCLAHCSYAGLSSRVAERSSAVRGCRAALSHMVLFACCLLPCCTLVFSLSWHTHLFFVSSMRYCLLARAFSSCFCLSSLLALTPCLHARFWTRLSPQGHRPARPVNGSGVPSVPELSFVFVSLRPLGGLPHLYLLCVFSCLFSGYLLLFHAVFAHVLCLPFVLSETLFVIFSLCWVVSTGAGLPSCITKRSSVRCGASELRLVI